MKNIFRIIIFLLLATSSLADDYGFTPGSGKTAGSDTIGGVEYPRTKLIFGPDGTNSGDVSSSNPLPVTSTATTGATGLGKVEDSASADGDVLVAGACRRNDAFASLTGSNGDYSAVACNAAGVPYVDINLGAEISIANGLLKPEDSGHTTGDAGVFPMGVYSSDPSVAFSGTAGDYTPFAVTAGGVIYSNIYKMNAGASGDLQMARAEDTASAPGDAVLPAGCRAVSSLGGIVDTNGDYANIACNLSGSLYVTPQSAASGTAIGRPEDDTWTSGDAGVMGFTERDDTLSSTTSSNHETMALKSDSKGALATFNTGSTANGLSVSSVIAASSNNATNVKASAGQVYHISACNTSAAIKYVRLYNKATSPTCGSDTPFLRYEVPASNCMPPIDTAIGFPFGTGIGFCITGAAGDSDNTSVTASDVLLNIGYK